MKCVLAAAADLHADRLRSAELFPRRECSVWGRERTTIWSLRVPAELLLHRWLAVKQARLHPAGVPVSNGQQRVGLYFKVNSTDVQIIYSYLCREIVGTFAE